VNAKQIEELIIHLQNIVPNAFEDATYDADDEEEEPEYCDCDEIERSINEVCADLRAHWVDAIRREIADDLKKAAE
jgi:hypothetical protein